MESRSIGKSIGIYIHIPFCRRKCVYCDFYSLPLPIGNDVPDDFVNAVVSELMESAHSIQKRVVDTIYFGGGTPSLLTPTQIADIITAIRSIATVLQSAEISMEANPDSVTPQKLEGYRNAGVNRISFGIQSACDKELGALSRLHNFDTAKAAVLSAKAAGFDNISADLMMGTPYQTKSGVIASIDELALLPITHISAYMLKVEEGTPLCGSNLLSNCMAEEELADCYLAAVSRLSHHGFAQYEISNFCKPGYESRHNMKYWQCEEYLGIGPSAHSFLNCTRFANPPSLEQYVASTIKEKTMTDLDAGGLDERIMLGLRLNAGISLDLLMSNWGENQDSLFALIKKLEDNELISVSSGKLSCTAKGFLVSSSVICGLLGL